MSCSAGFVCPSRLIIPCSLVMNPRLSPSSGYGTVIEVTDLQLCYETFGTTSTGQTEI